MSLQAAGEETEEAIRTAIGSDLEQYEAWVLSSSRNSDRYAEITSESFAERLLAVDYNDNASIRSFWQFLNLPSHKPIIIGKVHSRQIALFPQSGVIDPHSEIKQADDNALDPQNQIEGAEEVTQVEDSRTEVHRTVLGLWARKHEYRNGKYSDEGYSSGEVTNHNARMADSLQVMHVLGVIFARQGVPHHTEANNEWVESNYLLVVNVYDSSIWVLWSKYIYDEGADELLLAKEAWRGDFAVFPGLEDEEMSERVIFGKVADDWRDLAIERTLPFGQAYRPKRGDEEPIVTTAHWTPQGGIRRENDYRSMGPRLR